MKFGRLNFAMRSTKCRIVALIGCLLLPAFARAQSAGLQKAIETVLPRVVKLYGASAGMEKGFGTGVLVSSEGLVLTVDSLLLDAKRIRVVTHDGAAYVADVLGRDSKSYLALLQLKADGEADGRAELRSMEQPAARTGNEPVDAVLAAGGSGDTQDDEAATRGPGRSIGPFAYYDVACRDDADAANRCHAPLRPGDWVLAAGNAFKVAEGDEPPSLAHGVFSTRTRLDARIRLRDFPYHGDVLVIDAITSNPGAPGSPLVNIDGELVGLVGREAISNLTHTHLNYALPRDALAAFVARTLSTPSGDDLAKGGAADSAAQDAETVDLGIRISKAGFQSVLPFVDRVRRDSAAARAGVRKDDLILSVNGRIVADIDEYESRIGSLEADEPVDLVIRRGREILVVRIEATAKTP